MSGLDPIELQVVTGALRAACAEMGVALVRSAHSANIKERRDASTGLFDADGQMVMQAEHIPVHLGSMPAAVAAVVGERHSPGVSWILNDPYAGGTHLPDITVITPVFAERQPGDSRRGEGSPPEMPDAPASAAAGTREHARAGPLIGFAASRAHHADVGGREPGSMPADSRTLQEEGVVIAPRPLDEATLNELVARMRQPAERLADLRAQLAANLTGSRRLQQLAQQLGLDRLRSATDAVLDYAERRTRACLSGLPAGPVHAEDVLEAPDGDLQLCLAARVREGKLILDFSRPGAAVAAGNVETSSRVGDLVLSAFGRAQGEGTMNNLTLGDQSFSYYETIGGGQGACADADGASGVHVAMSNTLNTPVEALEREFPLRVVQYALRRGSGGAGAHRGGDGVVREIEVLRETRFSLIAERRRHAPRGAAGGAPGSTGCDLLDGVPLPGKTTGTLQAGQRLRIETPGGGGYGRPSS